MLTMENEIGTSEEAFDQLVHRANQMLSRQDCPEIPMDCSKITVVRSHMLDRLIRLHLNAQRAGARLILQNVNDLVLEVITRTRLDRMLRIRTDEGHGTQLQNHLTSRVK